MASLVLKPMIQNVDLIHNLTAVSTSPRNIILINKSGVFLVNTYKLIHHVGPLHPKRERRSNLRN